MKHLLLSVGLLMVSASLARADVWTTTDPDGTQARTVVRDSNQPARDYSNNNDRTFYPSRTTTITRGARVPDGVNQLRPPTGVVSSQLQVGTWVPSYPYYPYPYYPQQPYYPAPTYYPPTYTPLTPHAGIVTSGGYGAGYPYGYVPAQPNCGPYGYPYAQAPSWNFYGYNGPGLGGNSGYYNRSTNTTGGSVTIGGGGVRGSIGSSRTTTTGSYSTF